MERFPSKLCQPLREIGINNKPLPTFQLRGIRELLGLPLVLTAFIPYKSC